MALTCLAGVHFTLGFGSIPPQKMHLAIALLCDEISFGCAPLIIQVFGPTLSCNASITPTN
jgi:hypothetical protein